MSYVLLRLNCAYAVISININMPFNLNMCKRVFLRQTAAPPLLCTEQHTTSKSCTKCSFNCFDTFLNFRQICVRRRIWWYFKRYGREADRNRCEGDACSCLHHVLHFSVWAPSNYNRWPHTANDVTWKVILAYQSKWTDLELWNTFKIQLRMCVMNADTFIFSLSRISRKM